MMLVFKGDLSVIPRFIEAGFGPFELYVRHSNDLNEQLKDFSAIHFSHKLDNGDPVNLADDGETGRLSEELLKKTIDSAKKNNINKVVVHPPSINVFNDDKKDIIQVFSRKLENVYDPGVILTIENLSFWINLIYIKQPIFTEPGEFFEIQRECDVPIKLTLDIEHLYETSVMKVFNNLYNEFESKFRMVNSGKLAHKEVINDFENRIKDQLKNRNIDAEVNASVLKAIDELKAQVTYIHFCGSDYTNYRFNPETDLPMLGEHLPPGFEGSIFGNIIKDRIDHALWYNKLKDIDADMLMEVSERKDYDLINWLKKSRAYVEGLF